MKAQQSENFFQSQLGRVACSHGFSDKGLSLCRAAYDQHPDDWRMGLNLCLALLASTNHSDGSSEVLHLLEGLVNAKPDALDEPSFAKAYWNEILPFWASCNLKENNLAEAEKSYWRLIKYFSAKESHEQESGQSAQTSPMTAARHGSLATLRRTRSTSPSLEGSEASSDDDDDEYIELMNQEDAADSEEPILDHIRSLAAILVQRDQYDGLADMVITVRKFLSQLIRRSRWSSQVHLHLLRAAKAPRAFETLRTVYENMYLEAQTALENASAESSPLKHSDLIGSRYSFARLLYYDGDGNKDLERAVLLWEDNMKIDTRMARFAFQDYEKLYANSNELVKFYIRQIRADHLLTDTANLRDPVLSMSNLCENSRAAAQAVAGIAQYLVRVLHLSGRTTDITSVGRDFLKPKLASWLRSRNRGTYATAFFSGLISILRVVDDDTNAQAAMQLYYKYHVLLQRSFKGRLATPASSRRSSVPSPVISTANASDAIIPYDASSDSDTTWYCDNCQNHYSPTAAPRWNCKDCINFDLDTKCYEKLRAGLLPIELCDKHHSYICFESIDEPTHHQIFSGRLTVGNDTVEERTWIQDMRQTWDLTPRDLSAKTFESSAWRMMVVQNVQRRFRERMQRRRRESQATSGAAEYDSDEYNSDS